MVLRTYRRFYRDNAFELRVVFVDEWVMESSLFLQVILNLILILFPIYLTLRCCFHREFKLKLSSEDIFINVTSICSKRITGKKLQLFVSFQTVE